MNTQKFIAMDNNLWIEAEEFSSKYRSPKADYVDPFDIIKKRGIPIHYMNFFDARVADSYVMWEKNIDGRLLDPVVFLSNDLKNSNPGRLRFRCAHELLHILLQEADICCYKCFDPCDPSVVYDEFTVNYFTSCFLMPEESFKRALHAKYDFQTIARKFGTTVEQVIRRMCQGKRDFPFHTYAINNSGDVLFSYSFDNLEIGSSVINKHYWSSFHSLKSRKGLSCETEESGKSYYCTTKRLHNDRYVTFGSPLSHQYLVQVFMDFPE